MIMETVFSEYTVLENAEITIEANPGTLDNRRLLALRRLGVNRISIGLQAWQDRLLKRLGRIHNQEDFLINYHSARDAGFQNISVDIMFALPGQSLADWQETLQNVVLLKPEHISAYSLIVEEGTPFFEQYQKGQLLLTEETLDRQMYETAKNILSKAGYCQYEISNFAIPGVESVHNTAYWKTLPYIGCGLGAHSYEEGVRFHNTYDLESYIHLNGNCPQEDREELSLAMQQSEFMFCGLRMAEGVSYDAFEKRFGIALASVYGETLQKLETQGLLRCKNGRVFLTNRGIDVSNRVFAEFLL